MTVEMIRMILCRMAKYKNEKKKIVFCCPINFYFYFSQKYIEYFKVG